MGVRMLSTTVVGSTLTVQTAASATNQSSTAWARNLATNRYQCIPSPSAVMPRRRNGSLLSRNWFDMLIYTGSDHTGTAPGTAQALPGANSLNVKRVRAQLP
jgi:hypothetical protein